MSDRVCTSCWRESVELCNERRCRACHPREGGFEACLDGSWDVHDEVSLADRPILNTDLGRAVIAALSETGEDRE